MRSLKKNKIMGLLSSIGDALSKVVRPDKWFDSDTIVGKYLNATKYVNPAYYADKLGSAVTGLSDSERYLTGAAVLGGLAAGPLAAAGSGLGSNVAVSNGSARYQYDSNGNQILNYTPNPAELNKTATKNAKLLPFLGTALTAGSGLGSAALAYQSQQQTNAQQIALSKSLAEYNNTAQMAMWNAQFDKMSEYSSPAAQMARYMAAGINPYAALGNISSGEMPSSVGAIPADTPLLRSSGAAAAPFLSDTVAKSAQTYAVLGAADMALQDYNLDAQNKMLTRMVNGYMLSSDLSAISDPEVLDSLTLAKKYSINGNRDAAFRECKLAAVRASELVLSNEILALADSMELTQQQQSSALKLGKQYYESLLDSYFRAQIASNEYTATEVKKEVNSSVNGIIKEIQSSVDSPIIKNVLTVLVAGLASRLSAGSLPMPSMSFPRSSYSNTNTYHNQNTINR